MTFDPRPLLKEIARGKHGARDLTREQSHALFAAILAGEVTGAPLGAILVALRVKGETPDELAGMMDAVAPHVKRVIAVDNSPAMVERTRRRNTSVAGTFVSAGPQRGTLVLKFETE